MNQGPSSLINLTQDELNELLQDDFKLDERVQESVRVIFPFYWPHGDHLSNCFVPVAE